MKRRNYSILMLIIVILGFLLRIYKLGYHDFWFDEIYSIMSSHQLHGYVAVHPPLYYTLLHCWRMFFGVSEFSVRFPSLIFSVLSIYLIFKLGNNLFNNVKIGLYAASFMALSPFQLWYAQEARNYSMVLFLGLLSTLIFYKALTEDKNSVWVAFVIVSAVGLYTNYIHGFLLIAQLIYLLCIKKLKLGPKAILSFFIIALAFMPYAHSFLNACCFVRKGFWIPKPNLKVFITTLENFIIGYNAHPIAYFLVDFLLALLSLTVIYDFKRKELRKGLSFCLFCSFLPILLILIFSRIIFPIYLDRSLIIFSPFFYIIFGMGIEFLYNKLTKRVFTIALLLVFFSGIYSYYKDNIPRPSNTGGIYIKRSIKPIVRLIKSQLEPSDTIAFTNCSILPSFSFYGRNKGLPDCSFTYCPPKRNQGEIFTFYTQDKKIPLYYFFNPQFNDTNFNRPTVVKETNIPIYNIPAMHTKRIWVIASTWEGDGQLDENSVSVKDWLDKNLHLDFQLQLDGTWIFRYTKP